MKVDQLFKSNAVYVIYIFCAMSLMSQCNSCSHNNENERLRKEVNTLHLELDSLVTKFSQELVNKEEMEDIIKETPAWKTLRIEEISDKERISINALEEKEKFED
jgi:heme oxygenase|tara:strand:+ start:1063 stop:1377 length:315 start_codon:yes stop_codon:yes gene_type:complete